jgi:chromosome segregation ATPase
MRAFHNAVKPASFPQENLITRSISGVSRSALVLILLMLSVSASAQQPGPSDTQILQQLVTEVRQLRLALERTNSVNSRLQITLQRIQLQQNQVNRISGQLESLRNEIVKSEAEQGQVSSNLTDLESRIEKEENPDTQKTLQGEQKYMNVVAEQKTRVVQDERIREAELTSSLQAEQGKLSELQTQLDSLEKLIEPQQRHSDLRFQKHLPQLLYVAD